MSPLIRVSVECCIVFLAFFIRGFTGFGAGLVLAPLLVFFIDLQHVVAVSIFLQFVGGGYLSCTKRAPVDRKLLWMVYLPGCICSVLGGYVLAIMNLKLLLLLLGTLTVIFAIRMLIKPNTPPLKEFGHKVRLIGMVLGALSGLLQGLYGAGGPPIVFFFENKIYTKEILRATLLVYFFTLDALLIATFLLIPFFSHSRPLLDLNVFKLATILLIPTIGGAIIGNRFQHFISQASFRRAIASLLILAGVLIVSKGLSARSFW